MKNRLSMKVVWSYAVRFSALALVAAACSESSVKPTSPRTQNGPNFSATDPFNSTGVCLAQDAFLSGAVQGVNDNQDLASGHCTANDIRIATADVIEYSFDGTTFFPFDPANPISCTEDDPIFLNLVAHLQETATSERTDIGVWIGLEGSDGRTGTCNHYNLVNGTTGVSNIDNDSCGDMVNAASATVPLGVIDAVCQTATPTSTQLHIGSCLGWTQPGGDQVCPQQPEGATPNGFRWGTVPGTTSKCNCEGFDVPITVLKVATIEIVKSCTPSSDPGTFDLLIDGSFTDTDGTFGDNVACGGTTGARTVGAGTNVDPGATHTVAEADFTTANYTSTYSCTKNGEAYISSTSGIGPFNVDVEPDDAVVCTFVNVRKGNLTIIKNTVPDGATDFSFTSTGGLSPSSFSLDDDANATLSNTQTFTNITPGAYTVTEGAATGFDLTALTCSDANSTGNTGTRTASINVEAGESVTCTFTNTQQGTITIIKNTVPDGPTDFPFTSNVTGHTSFSLDDDANATLSNTETMLGVLPGAYTVTESVVAGFDLTALTCSDANSTGNTGTRTATINLEAGESVTCTFTNTQRGNITIIKNTVPDGPQDFSFTTTGTGLSSFSLDDDADPTLLNTKNFTNLVPGAYTVTEGAQTGFDLTALTCSDANSTGNTGTRTASINVEAGETVTCTFTNTARGTINIVKNTVPDGPTDFSFTSTVSGNANFSLDDDADPTLLNTKNMANVVAGAYSVTEGAATGFELTSISCSDANSTGNTATRTASINLEAGETVTCTFTNTQQARITIAKSCVGASSGTFHYDWTALGVSQTDFMRDCGESTVLVNYTTAFGTYVVTESSQIGWELTDLTCSGGGGNTTYSTATRTASIGLDAGEDVVCTFTNTANEEDGRMTGGGATITVANVRINKGLTIHCDIILSNNIELNWGKNNWHLEKPITQATCFDDPNLDQEPPAAPFDTFIGEGVGFLNGVEGSVLRFIFVDAGEPGTGDKVQLQVWAPGDDPDTDTPVLNVPLQLLKNGNLQAHYDQPHK